MYLFDSIYLSIYNFCTIYLSIEQQTFGLITADGLLCVQLCVCAGVCTCEEEGVGRAGQRADLGAAAPDARQLSSRHWFPIRQTLHRL